MLASILGCLPAYCVLTAGLSQSYRTPREFGSLQSDRGAKEGKKAEHAGKDQIQKGPRDKTTGSAAFPFLDRPAQTQTLSWHSCVDAVVQK